MSQAVGLVRNRDVRSGRRGLGGEDGRTGGRERRSRSRVFLQAEAPGTLPLEIPLDPWRDANRVLLDPLAGGNALRADDRGAGLLLRHELGRGVQEPGEGDAE